MQLARAIFLQHTMVVGLDCGVGVCGVVCVVLCGILKVSSCRKITIGGS